MKRLVAAVLIMSSTYSWGTAFPKERQPEYIQEHQAAVQRYAQAQGKVVPKVEDYTYGMNIDVAKLVRLSQDPRTCQVYPRLMTFEDTQGTLKTLRYSVLSQCINNK